MGERRRKKIKSRLLQEQGRGHDIQSGCMLYALCFRSIAIHISSKHRAHPLGICIFDFGLSQSVYPHSATGNRHNHFLFPLYLFTLCVLILLSPLVLLRSRPFSLHSLSSSFSLRVLLIRLTPLLPLHFSPSSSSSSSSLSLPLALYPASFSLVPYYISHSLLSLSHPLFLLPLSLTLFFSLFSSPVAH